MNSNSFISQDSNNGKVFSRRAFVIGGLQMCLLGVLGARLGWLQISQGRRYKVLSDKNRINIKMYSPSRGYIADRFGVPLATNTQSFRALITPEQTANFESALNALKKYIDIGNEQTERIMDRVKRSPRYAPIEVKNDLTWEEVSRIEVRLPELPGVSIDAGELRSYPLGDASAHIVGYVGLATPKEVEDDAVLRLPGLKTGKTGIEKAFDKQLRGQAGTAEIEVNVAGREVRELHRNKERKGKQVNLSIDAGLQKFLQNRLSKERSASAVLMDAHTGEIYAMASHPGFDPNMFTHGLSADNWEKLLAMPGYPLTNKAVAGQYPPASTFKMLVLLAGLKHGKITTKTSVKCSGYYKFGKDRFHCWKRGGHGSVDIYKALAKSCDTYFYELATKVGVDNIAVMAKKFGLGERSGVELREDSPGLVPTKSWKLGHIGEAWRPGETIVASIGQGYIQATPLQLAVMTARLVNGGYAVKPTIILKKGKRARGVKMAINAEHLKIIKQGMDSVVNDSMGTAFDARIKDPTIKMGGKTGTAQVRKITKRQRLEGIKNDKMPWKHRDHGLFVGYAPVENPRYICAVVVEHGGGSVSAVPIAHDLMIEVQKNQPNKNRG